MRSSASRLRRRTTLPKSSGWPTSPRRFGTPAPGLGQCGCMLHTTGALRLDIVSASTGFLFFCLCCGAGLRPTEYRGGCSAIGGRLYRSVRRVLSLRL
jgi:hypothetical protein